jgi:MoaA/NifB/PqqE/SkfB family radical SAM enzyme
VLWKFHKSPQEKAVVDYVGAMQDEAVAHGLSLHLRRLLDPHRGETVALSPQALEALFAEAQAEADREGIDLSLPQTGARLDRHCAFIEEGAAFIAADGGAHPCQFLWHRYACHLDGATKQVYPRRFGSLAETPLEEMWDGEAWRAFRDEVLAYDYPDCTNCPTVPCDDITGTFGDFEMDCHGVTVPCGHCPWCLGGVQCLD